MHTFVEPFDEQFLATVTPINPLRFPAIVLLAMLAACGEPDSTAPGSEEPVPAPEVDADPTPQTGRGGPSQTTSPDATTNSAPAAD